MMRFSLATSTIIVLLATALFAQSNPVPFVNQPLIPTAVAPGSPGFTLTVNGTGFVSASVVHWNGSPRTTTFVSASQLTASIAAADVAVASTATITVATPAPGGGVSNPAAFPIATPRSTLSFSATSTTVGIGPSSARIADLNGDGNADIVAPNTNSNTVSVLLGKGDGTFRPHVDYATAADPTDVTVADFNGDGKLDLAVANVNGSANNSLSVLLGNGDGTFRPHVDYAAFGEPFTVVAADLNRDGKLDLVTANDTSPGGVSVLLGNGDGTFQPYAFYEDAGYQTLGIAVGDFNHDGILDVVAAGGLSGSVSLFLGKGDGTFQPHIDFPAGNQALELTVADFDGDGNLDIAVANTSNSVSILLGRGDGTFQPQVQYTVPNTPFSITSVDVNGDGKLDLAVATGSSFISVSLLLGNGDGTFQPHVDLASSGAAGISAGDFNNDGLIDFSGANGVGVSTLIQDHGTVVALSPSSVKFATQLVGTVSSTQIVKLTNSGSSAISISSMSLGTPNFAVVSKCGRSVQPEQSCNILLYFTPTASGNLTDTLSIYDSGGGSPQLVFLSGAGTSLYWSPKFLDFGAITVHKTSPPQKITLTNEGSVRLSITQVTVVGKDKDDFTQVNACGTSLVAGASCTIDVWFTPRATGSRTAALTITDTGGASPQKVSLTGTGQ
jgi:hypothetical protein